MHSTPGRETSLNTHIQRLHGAEVAHLSTKQTIRHSTPFNMIHQYMRYIACTWGSVFRSIAFLSLNPIDFLAVLGFASGSSIILGVMLMWCITINSSPMQAIMSLYSHPSKKHGLDANTSRSIFHSITQSQVDAAKAALTRPRAPSAPQGERVFDLDIAKLLLQFSALMYERETDPILTPLVTKESSDASYEKSDNHTLHGKFKDDKIRDFCRTFGLEYEAVSELNSSDSAYSALFWDPNSSWIVVAFKGTSPAEYAEWVSDFNYNLVYAGDWLPGFSLVHGGFLERIFPADVSKSGGMRPWDTISTGIKLVAKSLSQKSHNSDAKINVFFTGHSLGCAISSLAYARAVLVQRDLGEHVVVRDGYIFAAPILCDVASVKAFDGAINEDYDMPRTLWRITNREDIVATGLPDYGDRKNSRFMNNSLLNFAHLGAEIRMRSMPIPSEVEGWPHITRGLPVVITSSISEYRMTMGISQEMSHSTLWPESLPFIGRFFQHATSYYWDQLQRVGLGLCQWAKTD